MNKKKEESSSTDIIEPTYPSEISRHISQKRMLSKSKRDEIHSNCNKKMKK